MITATARPATRKEKIDIDRVTQWGIGLCVTGLLISALCLHLSSRAAVSLSPPAELLLDLAILAGMTLFAMGVFGIVLGSRNWRGYFEAGLREVLLEPRYLESLSPEGRRDHLIEILKAEHGDRDIGREGRLLSLGLVSMILDMKGWKEYFEDGLLNIVLRPEFLKRLSQEQLTDYQIEVFKKYYKREDIDQEGRFLRYCLGHIHKYIAAPYREEIRVEMQVEPVSEERLRVSETMRYVCRMGEGGIQARLAWGMNEETLEVESLRYLFTALMPPSPRI